MSKNIFSIIILSLLCAFLLYAEDTKEIKFKELPANVQNAALKHVQKENITEVELIIEEDTIKYEIESKENGISKEITIAKDGNILEIEQEIAFSKLPIEAQSEIKEAYPNIEIEEIEAVKLFYYEVEGVVNGKTVEFKVFATGEIEIEVNDDDDDDEDDHNEDDN